MDLFTQRGTRLADPKKDKLMMTMINNALSHLNRHVYNSNPDKFDGTCSIITYLNIDRLGYKTYHWSENVDD